MKIFGYLVAHLPQVLTLTEQHAALALEGTVLAAAVAIPFGLWAYPRPRIRRAAASVTEVIQTIPSLALMAVLLIWLGIGDGTLVATLFLYALMPILHNTMEGLLAVDPQLVDVAKGCGMSRRQTLLRIQAPLAAPVILTGFRVALVTSVGIATIGVFIGAGGLGNMIYAGMQILSAGEIVAGALPAALLAVLFDVALSLMAARSRRRTGKRAAPGV